MSLPSLVFFAFLALLLVLDRLLGRRARARKLLLLAGSYVFAFAWDWRVGVLLMGITATSYVAARRVAGGVGAAARRGWLALSVAASVAALAMARHSDFFVSNAARWIGAPDSVADSLILEVALPVGFSFVVLRSIACVADVYRGVFSPILDPVDHALFLTFFPALLGGAATRAAPMLRHIAAMAPVTAAQLESGWLLILRGLVRMLAIAEVLAVHLVDPAFAYPAGYTPLFLLVALYALSLQLYMEAAGAVDIARGTARLFGFELGPNFDRPYLAASVTAFWQRWLTSVTAFFRHFVSLVVCRAAGGAAYAGLLLGFAAMGLWYGSGWNFLCFGLLHGGIVCLERWQRRRRRVAAAVEPPVWRMPVRVLATFHVVVFSRVLIGAADLSSAGNYLAALFDARGPAAPFDATGLAALAIAAALHLSPRGWGDGLLARVARWPVLAQALLIVFSTYALMALAHNPATLALVQR